MEYLGGDVALATTASLRGDVALATTASLGGDVALVPTASLGGHVVRSELHDAGADFPGKSVRALLAWLLRPHFHVNE